MRLTIILSTVGVIAIVSAVAWMTWRNTSPAVTVTPDGSFVLSTGTSSNSTELAVVNHTDRTLYGVQVEIKCDEPGVPPEHIVLVVESSAPMAITGGPPDRAVTIDAKDMVLGTTDAQQRRNWIVILSSVDPGVPRRIRVSGGLNIKSNARARVLGYRDSPGDLAR